jgi:hypothetical protein
VALGYLLDRLKRPRSRLLLPTGLLVAVFATTAQTTAPFEAPKIAAFTAPRDAARALVDPLPYGAPVITEASWFIALYLSMIEGYREDVLPIYQPSILFPALFAPLELNVGGTSLRAEAEIGGVLGAASESSLRSYIDTIGGRGPVFFEPNIELNARFRAIAHLRADGSSTLVRQQSSAVSPNYIDAAGARLTALREAALSDQIFFGADTQQYFETILTYTADLLRVAGHPQHAAALIERVCPPTQPPCSITIDANRALYLVDIGRSREAAEVLLAASLGEPGARRRVIPTLQIALSRLAPEEIEALQSYTPYRDIITQAGF